MEDSWIQFFIDAAIPSEIAVTYALTFSNNRIQMDMLLDLNKEYLQDMGITLMGDVIAILRHAKHVHTQMARAKVLSTTKSDVARSTTQLDAGENFRSQNSTSLNLQETSRQSKLSHSTGTNSQTRVAKRKTIFYSPFSEESEYDSSPKKVKKTYPPEKSSGYGPVSSLPPRKSIRQLSSQDKRTVFQRLGSECVTSTEAVETPSVTIIGLGPKVVGLTKGNTVVLKKVNNPPQSVFSRLGEKQVSSSTTTPNITEKSLGTNNSLPYVGILKSDVEKEKPITFHKRSTFTRTMTTDRSRQTTTISLKSRLGTAESVKPPSSMGQIDSKGGPSRLIVTNKKPTLKKTSKTNSQGILAKPSNLAKSNIKTRLGSNLDLQSTGGSKIVLPDSSTNSRNRTAGVIMQEREIALALKKKYQVDNRKFIYKPRIAHVSLSHEKSSLNDGARTKPNVFSRLGN